MFTRSKMVVCISAILAVFFMSTVCVEAADYVYKPIGSLPGSTEEQLSDFPGYIQGLYRFAVWSVGIAALLMISVGGFTYFTAAGNASKSEKAKSIITDALWGVVAVMLAWFILNIINPDILEFDLSSSEIFNSAQSSLTTGK